MAAAADAGGTKLYTTKTGKEFGGTRWIGRRGYDVVTDRKYLGKVVQRGIRSLLTLDDPESEFLQTELKDLHGQLKSLDESIQQIETRPTTEADLEAVTSALQRLDPIWDV